MWPNIRPLLRVSLKNNCPTGLSIISERSEPISSSLMSRRVPREVKEKGLIVDGESWAGRVLALCLYYLPGLFRLADGE